MDFYPKRSTEPDLKNVEVRLLGTGASAPTKERGQGITVARSGTGVYTLTFPESPGVWAGATHGHEATTASGLAGFTVVVTPTSSTVITVSLFNGSNAAADLAAAQWLNLTLRFAAGRPS